MNAKYLLLYNLIKSRGNDSFAVSFLRSPYVALREVGVENTPRLYQVVENAQDSNEEDDLYRIDAIPVYSGEDISNIIFEDASKMSELCKKWVYITHNFRRKDRVVQLQKELSKLDAYFIVSAGRFNRYHHPHSVVVKDLLFNGHHPYIVTECKSSEVKIVVEMIF